MCQLDESLNWNRIINCSCLADGFCGALDTWKGGRDTSLFIISRDTHWFIIEIFFFATQWLCSILYIYLTYMYIIFIYRYTHNNSPQLFRIFIVKSLATHAHYAFRFQCMLCKKLARQGSVVWHRHAVKSMKMAHQWQKMRVVVSTSVSHVTPNRIILIRRYFKHLLSLFHTVNGVLVLIRVGLKIIVICRQWIIALVTLMVS